MSYTVELPDGKVVEFPDSVSREQAAQIIRQQLGTGAAPKTGLGAALSKGAANLLSSGRTGIESLFGDATQAGRAGVARGEETARKYADQVSLDRVTDAYKQRGFLPAVGEAISQIPASLAEQAPNIAATAGGAFTGARLGALVGPYGAVVGGGIGALVPSFVQQFGSNVERQVQEAPGQPVSTGRAAAAGAGQAVLDVAATAIPLGKTILGKILGSKVKQAFLRGDKAAAEALAKESLFKVLAKGTGVGVAAEAPTEVVQAVLERAQAGLPLTSDDALKEYAENAYGAVLLSPIGAAGRVTDRSSARDTLESEQRKRVAEERAAAAKAEEERKNSPEYLQQVASQYESVQARLKEAGAALGKFPKEGTEAEKLDWQERKQEVTALRNEAKELAPEYNALKPKLAALREKQRLSGMSPEEVLAEYSGVKLPEGATGLDVPAPEATSTPQAERPNPYAEIGQGIARAAEQRRLRSLSDEQYTLETQGGVTTPLSAEARKDRNEFVVQQGVAAAQANPELAQNLLASKGKLEIPGLTPQDVRAIYDALNRQAKEDAAQQKRAAKAKPAPSTFSLTSSPQQANENLISSARDLQQPNREVVEAEREALLRIGAKPAEGPTALLKKVFGQKDDLTQKSPDLQFVADQLMGQVPRVPPAAENIPGRQRQGLGRTPTRITLQEIVDQMRVKAKALSAARETRNSQAINALRDELADLRAKAQEAEANGGFLYTQPQEPTPEQEAFERATDTRPVTFAPMAKPAAAGPAQVEGAGVGKFDSLEDALTKERDGTTSEIESGWMDGKGRRQQTPIERAVYEAVTASVLDADAAASIVETALKEGRADLALYAAQRAARAAESMSTTPGVSESSPKYEAIKNDLVKRKQKAQADAQTLIEKAAKGAAPATAPKTGDTITIDGKQTAPTESAGVSQSELERIDAEERIAKPALRKRIAEGKEPKYEWNTQENIYIAKASDAVVEGDASAYKIKLTLTPDEKRAVKRADADMNLADTPEERAAARKRLTDAFRPAVDRALAEKSTATPIAPAAPKTGDTITVDAKPAEVVGQTDIFSAPSEEQVSTKTSEKTGNTTKTYGGYVDGDGVPVELSIVRRADGTLFRVFAKYGDGIRSEFDASYGPGITDEQLVKAVAEPSDWEKVAAKSTATPAAEERGQPQRVAQQPGPETALQAAQKKSVAERTELADKAEQLAQTPGLPRARVNALRTLQRALLSGERDAKAARPILERLSRGIETPAPPAEEPQIPTKTVTERRVAMPEGVVADVAPAKKKDTERQTKQGLPTEVVVKRAEPLSDEELDREETRAARRAAIKTVQRKTEEAVQASEKAVDDIYVTIDRQDLASVTYWSDKMQLEIAELEAASRAAGDDFSKADEAKLRRARTVLKQLEDSQKQLRAAANNAREGTEEKQAERRAAREAERLQAMDEAAKYFKVAEQQDELVALYQSRVNELRSDLISKLIDHNVAMQKIKDLKPIGRELLGVPLDALEDAVTQQRDLFTDAIERARVVRETVPKYLAAVEALDEQGGVGTSDAEANSMRATADLLQAQLKYTDEELDLLNRTFETTRAARDVGRLQKQLLSADDVKPTEAELDEYQRALSKAQEREATARAKASEAERTLTRLASEDRLAQEKAAEAARDARLARERQQAEALIEAKERGAGTQYRMLNPVERAFREGAFDVSEEIEQLRAEAIAAGVPKKQLLAQEKRTRQKSDVVSLNRSLGVALKDLAKVEKAIQEGEASMAKAPLTDEAGTRVFKLQKQLESLEAQFAKERSAEKRAVLLERINSLQDRIKNRTTGRDPAIEARLKQLREQQAEAEAAATEAVGQEERMQTRADAYLDRNERVPQILVDAIQAANMRWRAAETQSEALQEKIRKLEDIEPAKQAFKGQGPLMRQRKLLEVRIAEYLDRLQDLGLSETDVAMGGAFEERRAEAARKKLQQAINERKQREAAAVAAGTGEQRMTKQEAKAELAQEKPATSGEALEKSQAKKRSKSEKTAFTGTGGPSGVKALEQERDAAAPAKAGRDRSAQANPPEARRSEKERITQERSVVDVVYAELDPFFKGVTPRSSSKVQVYYDVDEFRRLGKNSKYAGKIPSNTKGVVFPDGTAVLFASNIPEGRALGVLLHEVGAHLGFRKIFTAPELKALANVIRNWATRADNSVECKVGQAALKRVEDAKTPDSQVDEELIAYAVEEATNAGKAPSAAKGPVTAWLNRIREKFVAALEKFVGGYNKGTLKLSAQDLVDMAYGAANMELRGVEPAPRKGVMGSPDVMMSKAMRAFTQTPEFKRWFGDSKVVDAEGKPLVVYHGTVKDFSVFDRNAKGVLSSFDTVGSWFATDVTPANTFARKARGAKGAAFGEPARGSQIMPVYLRIEKPFRIENIKELAALWKKHGDGGGDGYRLHVGVPEKLRSYLRSLGYDGLELNAAAMDPDIASEGSYFVAFAPEQIKSAIGNNGGFDPSNPDIRFSLGAPTELMFSKSPKYSTDKAAAMGRIAESLVAPQKSMVDRIKLNALGLRTQLVDAMAPVEKFAEYLGKQTEDSLRATQLMYNVRMHGETSHFMGLAASTGVVRRQEVKRDDGRTEYILRAEEGANLKDVMRELKDVPGMDPEAANINYSMHRIVKRYRGLSKRKPGATLESLFGTDAEGNPVVSMAKVLEFEKLLDESPDVKAAFERADAIYDQYNKDLMRFLAQSSAISPELADELTRYNDYVPYYRVRNGNVELVVEGMKEGPIRIGNIKDQPHLKELVGGNAAILDFSTSAVNNTHMLLDMGLRNYAARSVAWELKKMGMGAIGSDKVAGEDVFFFYEKGELRSMRVATDALGIPADLLVKGMAGIPMMRFAALQMLGLPARILRQAVVLNPVYALRQVLRDSPASMLVAGANGIPVLSAVQNLKRGPTRDLLERSGVTGGQVYTGSTEDIGMVLRTVNDGKASWMQALRKLESMSMTADAATRAAQYNSYRKQGLSDMEATFMSMESMNFSKRGLSPSMHMVSTMIPFFNAQIQGLDVLYKAARGKMPLNERLKIRQKLFVRGAMLAAGTLAYAALMQDEDEYKNALPEEKYNNWFVRIPGVEPMVRIPIPFELGYIFKAMPEAAFNLLNGSEEGRTVAKAFGTIVKNTIPGGSSMLDVKGVPIPIPLPQAMKPAIEAALGKSFFTGRDIESAPERAMDPEKRVRDTTSGLAKELGELGGFSPVMIDYILRGYLSSIGPLLAQTVSLAIPTGDSPERVVRRLNEYPLVGPLFQPKDGTGVINLVYDRVNEIERAKKTFDDLVSKGNRAEAQQYLRENSDRLSMEGLAGNFTQVMKQVSQAEAAVRAAVGVKSISPQEGREILDKLRQRKIQIAESVKSQMAVRKELQAAR